MKHGLHWTAGLLTLLAVNNATVANHVHLQIAWREDALVLEIYDFEAGTFPSDAFPFVVGNAGMNLVPAATAFAFLGEAGATSFALPQNGNPNLPFLGIGVDNVPGGTFAGNHVQLRLVSVVGPGHLAVYQVDCFGQPTLQMNSRDGIDSSADRITLAPGGHQHQNWAFNAPGEYRVTFVAHAVRLSTGQTITSTPATYRFRVLPPPAARLELKKGGSSELSLTVQSRVGARLQIAESIDLALWTTNSGTLLKTPAWQRVLPVTSEHRFWRVQEVFE